MVGGRQFWNFGLGLNHEFVERADGELVRGCRGSHRRVSGGWGIVIMNIMLASVTERTREIGLRRSLGARRKHIVLQFVTESAVLAAVGGLIGIVFAYGLVALGRASTSIPMQTPMNAVILSLSVSTAVGLFFGIYPAMRAAKLDPIEALRADG